MLACYNEAEHLERSFAEIKDTLEQARFSFEILFVDDVSRDRTREIIAALLAAHPQLALRTILHERNLGRGASVSDGFRAARGEIAGYIDVDLEVHSRYIPSLVRTIERGADIATLRRIYAFQVRSLDRYFMSRGYSFLVRRLLGSGALRHRDRLQVLRARARAAAARRDRGPRLVLGHRVHGAGRAARAAYRRGARRLHPSRGQDVHGARRARLASLLRAAAALPAYAAAGCG